MVDVLYRFMAVLVLTGVTLLLYDVQSRGGQAVSHSVVRRNNNAEKLRRGAMTSAVVTKVPARLPKDRDGSRSTTEHAQLSHWCAVTFTLRNLFAALPKHLGAARAAQGNEEHLLGFCQAQQWALEEQDRQDLERDATYGGYETDDALRGSTAQRELPQECEAIAALLPSLSNSPWGSADPLPARTSLRTSYHHAFEASCCTACTCRSWCAAWAFAQVPQARTGSKPDNCWLFSSTKAIAHFPSFTGVTVGEARAGTGSEVAFEPAGLDGWSAGMHADVWEGGKTDAAGGGLGTTWDMHQYRRRRIQRSQQRTRSGLAHEVTAARRYADDAVARATAQKKAFHAPGLGPSAPMKASSAWSVSEAFERLRTAVNTVSAWGEASDSRHEDTGPAERSGWLVGGATTRCCCRCVLLPLRAGAAHSFLPALQCNKKDCVRPRCSRAPHCAALWAQVAPEGMGVAPRARSDAACFSESGAGAAWSDTSAEAVARAAANATAAKPCCTMVMFEMLRDLSRFLASKSLPSALAFGTLLGLVRSGSVIPFTADIDISMPAWARDALIKDPAWTAELAALGYSVFLSGVGRVCVNAHHPRFGTHPRPPAARTWAALSALPEDTEDVQTVYIGRNPYVDIYVTDADGTTSITP